MIQTTKMKFLWSCFFVLTFSQVAFSELSNLNGNIDWDIVQEEENHREAKIYNPLQVVRFKNEPCVGTSRNGTCYLKDECEEKGGSPEGNCAYGFGVCCVFNLGCGGRAAENCTYLTQSSVPNNAPCTYTVCKCSSDICRIRFDFTRFNLAPPVEGTTDNSGPVSATDGGAIGDCVTDRFSITSPGNDGTPVICGYNTGQHMIVDASDACNVASFDIGSGSNFNREWEIKVTQYACGDENGGPDGCLQYFTGTSGRIASFNYPTNLNGNPPLTATHLSNQCYTMCFRRELNHCRLCFSPSYIGNSDATMDTTTQASFGLSLSNDMEADLNVQAERDSNCPSDYLLIPEGFSFDGVANSATLQRLCGRVFTALDPSIVPPNPDDRLATQNTVCTERVPFRISFKTDRDEVTAVGADPAIADPTAAETALAPGGIIGFSLDFQQVMCP